VARDVTCYTRICTTHHLKMFGKPKDVSKFKALGCECFMYINKERRQGSTPGRAHMGIASDDNTSGWKWFYLVKILKNKIYISNQVRFNERVFKFPMRSTKALAQHADSSLIDGLNCNVSDLWKWNCM
jgi:hypothetical protein